MTEIYEDETVITYFAGDAEQDYDTFEEAEWVVNDKIAMLKSDYANFVSVKQVHVNEDGGYVILTGKFSHNALVNLVDSGHYLVTSKYAGNGTQVLCNNAQKVRNLIQLNINKLVEAMSFVKKETMTIHDRTNDVGFTIPEIEIHEGTDYADELIDPVSSDFVVNGVGLNLESKFEYEIILINA